MIVLTGAARVPALDQQDEDATHHERHRHDRRV